MFKRFRTVPNIQKNGEPGTRPGKDGLSNQTGVNGGDGGSTDLKGTGGAGEPKPFPIEDLERGNANRFLASVKDGEFLIYLSGPIFPKNGGPECGGWGETFNLTKHIEEIVRRVINEPKAD